MAFKPSMFTAKPSAKVAQTAGKKGAAKPNPFAKGKKCAKCGKTGCKC